MLRRRIAVGFFALLIAACGSQEQAAPREPASLPSATAIDTEPQSEPAPESESESEPVETTTTIAPSTSEEPPPTQLSDETTESTVQEKPFCPYLREIERLDQQVRDNADDPMAWNQFLTHSENIREDLADSLGGADPYYQALGSAEFYERLVDAWGWGLTADEFAPGSLLLLEIGQDEERVLEARAQQFCGITLEPIDIAAGLSL